MKFALIAAVDKNFGLGKNNTLPWRLPADLKHFSKITTDFEVAGKMNAVIMGRRTWESLPEKSKPLKNRLNVVLSKGLLTLPNGVLLASSLDQAFVKLGSIENLENIFVIGGGKVFEEAIQHRDCEKIYLTQIEGDFKCDAFFPRAVLEKDFVLVETSPKATENALSFQFIQYKRRD